MGWNHVSLIRHVFGVVATIFIITTLIVLYIEGKVVENEYLEQLASEIV